MASRQHPVHSFRKLGFFDRLLDHRRIGRPVEQLLLVAGDEDERDVAPGADRLDPRTRSPGSSRTSAVIKSISCSFAPMTAASSERAKLNVANP